MKYNIPYRVRAAVYGANVLGSPIVAYLLAKGVIGTLEVGLWGAEVAAVMAMAGLNVQSPNQETK